INEEISLGDFYGNYIINFVRFTPEGVEGGYEGGELWFEVLHFDEDRGKYIGNAHVYLLIYDGTGETLF
ncbi:MAG: hypothetical protein GTO02_05400, partial [Candidatus Dadabacteria bacterium]|nr:hypothetical protein [Candidatus Dadabacteria bacterium]